MPCNFSFLEFFKSDSIKMCVAFVSCFYLFFARVDFPQLALQNLFIKHHNSRVHKQFNLMRLFYWGRAEIVTRA